MAKSPVTGTPGEARKTRGAASKIHPGVSITPDDPNAPAWRVRSNDPRSPKRAELDRWFRRDRGATWDGVQHFAIEHAKDRLTRRAAHVKRRIRAELYGEAIPDPVADVDRRTITQACADYYGIELASAPNRSRDTLRNANGALQTFCLWCQARGHVYLDQLNTKTLAAFFTWWVVEHRQRNGKPYGRNSINHGIKWPRTTLYREIRLGNVPHLNSDIVKGALPHTPLEKDRHRRRYGVKGARPLSSTKKIRRLLRAALAYDARPRSELSRRRRPWVPQAAPDIATLLLGGMRLGEYTFLRCRRARASRSELALIKLVGKGLDYREITYRGISPVGAAILLELTRGRGPTEYVSEHTYGGLASVLRVLHRDYSAPKCSPHDLRATCATFQCAVRNVDANRRADRLGHGVVMQHKRYVKRIKGLKFGARSLEDAMRCKKLMARVLAALEVAPRVPRATKRPRPSRPNTNVFLARDIGKALAEVRDAPPKPRAKPRAA